MTIPKRARIIVDLQGQTLKGYVELPTKEVLKLESMNEINSVLQEIYDKENVTIADLIGDKRLIIVSAKVFEKYNITDNKLFYRIKKEDKLSLEETGEKEETIVPESLTPLDDKTHIETDDDEKLDSLDVKEEKEEDEAVDDGSIEVKPSTSDSKELKEEKVTKKKGIKLRKVCVRVLAGLTGIVLTGMGINYIINYMHKKSNNGSDDYANDHNYQIDINDDGNEYSYNLPSDESIIIDEEQGVYIENPQEDVNYSPFEFVDYNYGSLGSSLDYEDMATQLDVIDNYAIRNEQFQFENLVIADDYDAIYAINNMRNDVLNGSCDNKTFMDTIVRYVFENNNYINGSFIESYNSLHPYAQYIVTRISQGMLQTCYDYNNYDVQTLIDTYNTIGSELYTSLTANTKTK